MTTAAEPINLFGTSSEQSAEKRDFAQQLRQQTIACRVRHEKLYVRKALSREQLRKAAQEFHADAKVLSAAKKLIDTRDPAYRKVVSVRSAAGSYWKSITAPYPEPGTRLIRKSAVAAFTQRMERFHAELIQAAAELHQKYDELRERARVQLGELFNESDYPSRLDDAFDLEWDFPSVEPPSWLKDVHPELYEQECNRIRARFEEAVKLTEEALAKQLAELVAHLAERLKGDADGKPKVFRDTAVKNLQEFFEQFRAIDTGSNGKLQELVNQAQQIVGGVTADDLRGSDDARTRVAVGLAEIQQQMDQLMINRPRRAISLEEEGE